MKPRCLRWLLLVGVAVATGAEVPAPAEPAAYRMDDYRTPTPATLTGATVLTTDQAHSLWLGRGTAFIDVLPRPPRPVGLPPSSIWRPRPRSDVPGSIWLPDTGYGALAPIMEEYFRHGLEQASRGDRNRLLVFYCLANCWMSWNAAKRALALGYARVGWYRDGTDGWTAAGLPLEPREPVPRPSMIE